MISQTVSHYRVLAKIGQGGMGVVYRAEDTKLLRVVALKFLRADVLESEEHSFPSPFSGQSRRRGRSAATPAGGSGRSVTELEIYVNRSPAPGHRHPTSIRRRSAVAVESATAQSTS